MHAFSVRTPHQRAGSPSADQPFHFSQLYIILDKTDTLLEVFAGGLQEGKYSQDTFEYVPLQLCFKLQLTHVLADTAQCVASSHIFASS